MLTDQNKASIVAALGPGRVPFIADFGYAPSIRATAAELELILNQVRQEGRQSSGDRAGLNWQEIAEVRGEICTDLGARLCLARMAIENAVDVLANRGRFGSPDDALASLQATLAALRSGSTPQAAPVEQGEG